MYIEHKQVKDALKLTCSSEASHQSVSQLARSYEAHTHPACECAGFKTSV